jgi:hypothetical protein
MKCIKTYKKEEGRGRVAEKELHRWSEFDQSTLYVYSNHNEITLHN